MQGELWGKIEQVLSTVHVLCLTLKKLSQAIAHQKNHTQLKGQKNISCPGNDKIEIISFQKHFLPMQKHNDLFELKFNLFKLKSWGNRVSVNLLSGGMPLVHRNPYPILYHDQLDFAALFCNERKLCLYSYYTCS